VTAPRVLFYSQPLVGVGHYYRVRELARALSRDFAVHLIDGGRTISGVEPPDRVALTRLPPVFRDPTTGHLATTDETPLPEVLGSRLSLLVETVRAFAPDLLVIEYFPFQRWELATEILAAIDRARASNPRVVVCSGVRDVPRTPSEALADSVISTLNARFDHVLVHGDDRVTRLQDHVPRISEVRIPILYTGYVAPRIPPGAGAAGGRYSVVSAGGGIDGFELLAAAARAWSELARSGAVDGRRLVMFTGPFTPERDCLALRRLCAETDVVVRPFSDDFLSWLAGAEMSISRAGYNTCASVLEARVPAVLVPGRLVSDQVFRARRLAAMHLAEVVDQDDLAERLPVAMLRCLARPRVEHTIALDGAEFMHSFATRVCGVARS
jgi:predicted glycosyltransferase